MHKVNSLVIIGSFFILIYNENLPRPTAKEKIRRKADTFSRAYEAAALIKSRPPFLCIYPKPTTT